MPTFDVLLIAMGLCMDSFALAISQGMIQRQRIFHQALRLGTCFAIFQGTMLLAGWFAGIQCRAAIEDIDHWIAFGLLLWIGAHMMLHEKHSGKQDTTPPDSSLRILCLMALSTSIDALAVGVSFAIERNAILPSALTTGLVTFIFASGGVLVGRRIGLHIGKVAQYIGGTILIGVGIKILVEHLS